MSASELRDAAALIRVRAGFATPGQPRWHAGEGGEMGDVYTSKHPTETSSDIFTYARPADAAHIAAADPTVMLAVARLLEAEADAVEIAGTPMRDNDETLAVARAYLRSDS